MSSESTDLQTRDPARQNVMEYWTSEELTIIKNQICKGASNAQLRLFAKYCQRTGLDPFANQIHGVVRKGKLTIQTGIDGLRLIAQRSGEYKGQTQPEWCGPDGQWTDIWLEKKPPKAARVGVYRQGFDKPVYGVARYDEYKPSQDWMWKKMPSNQLAKCAEAQGIRKAFPNDTSGLYADVEMGQADDDEGELIEDATVDESRTQEMAGKFTVNKDESKDPVSEEASEPSTYNHEPANTDTPPEPEGYGEAVQGYRSSIDQCDNEEQIDEVFENAREEAAEWPSKYRDTLMENLDQAYALWQEREEAQGSMFDEEDED